MLLLTQRFGGGNGSTARSGYGSSLASADFSGLRRGDSGKGSAAIDRRSHSVTAARSSWVKSSVMPGNVAIGRLGGEP